MFVDSTQLSGAEIHTDICIIGTGPAALTIAHILGARRDVWLLEAGPEDGGRASQELYRGTNIGLPYFDLDGCRSRQFGGSSNCWGGFCRLFDECDFEVRPKIPYSGWPVRRGELMPYFERAHTLCQLGPLDYSWERWAHASQQGPSPFTGPHVVPEIRQKANFDVAALKRELVGASHAHVCVNATVTDLVTDAGGRAVTAVEFQDAGGRRHTLRASTVVLAAGGIENPRLLLASRRLHAGGVGNHHDLVGRFFMEHIDFDTGLFKPADPDRFRQQLAWRPAGGVFVRNSLAIAESIRREEQLLRCFFHLGDQTVDHAWGYRSAAHLLGQLRQGRAVHNLRYHWQNIVWDRVPLAAAARWRLHLTRKVPGASGREGLWPLRVTAEPSPNRSSRVTLSTERDRVGLPKVVLDWRINASDYAHVRRSLGLFEQDVARLGLGHAQVAEPSRWATRGTYHHMGTTRMSDDPRQGVVDANCRVHGVSNLYVAGSSVFPTAGSGTPTLMIVALAVRLAEHLGTRATGNPLTVRRSSAAGGTGIVKTQTATLGTRTREGNDGRWHEQGQEIPADTK